MVYQIYLTRVAMITEKNLMIYKINLFKIKNIQNNNYKLFNPSLTAMKVNGSLMGEWYYNL